MTAGRRVDTAAPAAAYPPADTLRTAQFATLIAAAPHPRNPNRPLALAAPQRTVRRYDRLRGR
jgi:hypothetical protein